jgi:lipopolysaccharide/colanic/teichoic acid biosynthesis glycosyltransferase
VYSPAELAQNGRGIKRATRTASEFLRCVVTRIRVLCASESPTPKILPATKPSATSPLTSAQSKLWFTLGALERVVAGLALTALFPALMVAAIIVAILSRQAPLVAHRRVGYMGREIWILKLRTMWPSSPTSKWDGIWIEYLPESVVPVSKAVPDSRITSSFAAFCRQFSIDEWPQLWQVAIGTMTLVGPRPLTALELRTYYGPAAELLLQVKPGLIGLWQVRGRSSLTYRERLRFDVFMLRNWSFRLYLHIFLSSIPAVLSGRNAS